MREKINNYLIFSPEAVGKQLKYWFINDQKGKCLYKEMTCKQDGSPVYDDVSECLATSIAKLIGISTADYYLCEKDGKRGIYTTDFLNNENYGPKKEEFFDGVFLIHQIDPDFKNKSLLNPQTRQYYTAELILQSVKKYGLEKNVLEMLVYDCLIGNRDRNPSNYGIIINHENNTVRFAPLFDNCTSLGVSMVEHRLDKCFDEYGKVVDQEHLNVVVHNHILGKVTLDRHLQYKEKRVWDRKESDRVIRNIEVKKRELKFLVDHGKMTESNYHKALYKEGNDYQKYDISTSEYQPLFEYLTLFYPDEIEGLMNRIKVNVTENKVDEIFSSFADELPAPRLAMAKEIVLQRANWIVNHYEKNKNESKEKLL